MVNLLGAILPDRKLVKIALLAYHGISHRTSTHIMARLQFHDQLRVQDLTEVQLNSLSALLSAPSSAPRLSTPLKPFGAALDLPLIASDPPQADKDPVSLLVIEEDLRRIMRNNIAHHRTVGTLTGRQHAMGLPVRGQRNKTNGKTAKRLNRIERRNFSISVSSGNEISGSRVLSGLRMLQSSSRPSLFTNSRC